MKGHNRYVRSIESDLDKIRRRFSPPGRIEVQDGHVEAAIRSMRPTAQAARSEVKRRSEYTPPSEARRIKSKRARKRGY